MNLDDVLDLLVLHDMLVGGSAYVERLSTQGKDAEVVAAYDNQTGDGQSLGRVT